MGEKVEREVYALTDLEMMCEKYYKYVNSYALSLCCDETLAEDITQETFCNAIKNIDSFKGNCQIETWLCSIARNVFLNFMNSATTMTRLFSLTKSLQVILEFTRSTQLLKPLSL